MCEYCNLKYTMAPDEERVLMEKVKEEDNFRRKFSLCWNDTFYESIKYRVEHKRNCIYSIVGPTGSGKSWAGLYIAQYIGHVSKIPFPLDARNIVFTHTKFIEAIKGSKPGEAIVQDEQRKLNVGWGVRAAAETVQDIERIIRKRQNHFIYIAPTLESHLESGILEPCGINHEYGISRLMFYDNHQLPRGRVYTKSPNAELLANYEKKKDEFIEMIVGGNVKDQYLMMEKIVRNLLTDQEFLNLSNKPKRVFYIAKKFPDLTRDMHEWLAELATGASGQ